ncbi:hypothetical protein AQV86_05800 [Nanohaloarchaea archaeon SG9]|nr:hypothetical protein AQV86_05800 [Nanohaloarchaea archaeon SG9]
MESDQDDVPRRYVLQTLGALGTGGLAGCLGGDSSDSSEDPEDGTETDSTPEDTSTPEPDYSLPESEHVNPVDMATEWMIFPDDQGDDLEAVAMSPSKLSENYDASFSEDIGADDEYGMFEFSHFDIPETYVQKAMEPWESLYKVDQLPGNVSEEDVAQQLEDAGYSKQHERGDFEVYRGEGGFHAVGNDRHVVVLEGDIASISQQRDLMFRVLEETNENRYQISELISQGFEALNVGDSLTVQKGPGGVYMPSTDTSNHQPQLGISSVDFSEGEKFGAWPFEDRQTADNALTLLENKDVRYGYDQLELQGNTVTASGGNYEFNEMNNGGFLQFSVPKI